LKLGKKRVIEWGEAFIVSVFRHLMLARFIMYPIVSTIIKSVTQHLAMEMRIKFLEIISQILMDPHFHIDFD
jgi:hypothetical protein